MDLATVDSFKDLGVALALGFVVGLERGWSQRHEEDGTRFAGVRTFTLIGLLGGLTAVLEKQDYREIAAIVFITFGLFLVSVIIRSRERNERGITTIVAALLVYVLAFIAGLGEHIVAAAAAVVIAVVLGIKDALHDWIDRVERAEIDAILKLLVISLVVLPILPNKGYGPWEALNPYQIWWMVVLISGISFLGHFALKWMPPGRGLLLTSLVGGLASSTAIAVSFARMGRNNEKLAPLLAAGVIASSSVMFPRILLVTAAFSPALTLRLLPAFLCAVLAGGAAAWWLWSHQTTKKQTVETPKSSFDLTMPLQFGAVLAVVMVVTAAAREWIGDAGLYVVAAIAGITDVDAIVLTSSKEAQAGLSIMVATIAVLIVAAVNTISKAVIVASIGGRAMMIPVAASFAFMIVMAGVGFAGTLLFGSSLNG